MKNYFASDSHGTACSPAIHGVLWEIRKSGLQSNKKAAHPFFSLAYQTSVRSNKSDYFLKLNKEDVLFSRPLYFICVFSFN